MHHRSATPRPGHQPIPLRLLPIARPTGVMVWPRPPETTGAPTGRPSSGRLHASDAWTTSIRVSSTRWASRGSASNAVVNSPWRNSLWCGTHCTPTRKSVPGQPATGGGHHVGQPGPRHQTGQNPERLVDERDSSGAADSPGSLRRGMAIRFRTIPGPLRHHPDLRGGGLGGGLRRR